MHMPKKREVYLQERTGDPTLSFVQFMAHGLCVSQVAGAVHGGMSFQRGKRTLLEREIFQRSKER